MMIHVRESCKCGLFLREVNTVYVFYPSLVYQSKPFWQVFLGCEWDLAGKLSFGNEEVEAEWKHCALLEYFSFKATLLFYWWK